MIRRFAVSTGMALCLAMLLPTGARTQTAAVAAPPAIVIDGAVNAPRTLSIAELQKMPQTTIHVVNSHNHQAETYQGVRLDMLLQQAGVPHGEAIRGKWMAAYVLATAADGYRVVYSLAELDASFQDSEVLVAYTRDGAPLGASEGPFKLVAPHDKRPARWIRMLKSITVALPN